MEFIQKHKDKYSKWEWDYLSINSNITLDIIKNTREMSWNLNLLATNPNITLEDIHNNEDIFQHKNRKRYLSYFSYNPNLTLKIIKKNPHIHWVADTHQAIYSKNIQ